MDIAAARIATGGRRRAVVTAMTAAGMFGGPDIVVFHFMCRSERNDVDEKGNEHADQGVDHAVDGESGDAGVGTMRDRDGQKGDASDVGQGVFPHEIGQVFERCDRQRDFLLGYAGKGDARLALDDLGHIHQGDDAGGNQQVGPDRMRFQRYAADDEQRQHTRETADQGADSAVQADTEGAFDFRLDTDDRRDRRIEGRPGTDIEKQVNQAANENGYSRLDYDDSHNGQVLYVVFLY